MTATDKNDASDASSVWQRAWPLIALAVALLLNVLWIAMLGYALIWLL